MSTAKQRRNERRAAKARADRPPSGWRMKRMTQAEFDETYPPEDRLTFQTAEQFDLDMLINGEACRYRGPQDDLTPAEVDAAVEATIAARIRQPSTRRAKPQETMPLNPQIWRDSESARAKMADQIKRGVQPW